MYKRICRRFRCRSIRDYFLICIFSTVLMFYISFKFSHTWKQAIPHGIGYPNVLLPKALKRSILAQKQQTPEKWSPSMKAFQAYNFSSHLHKLLLEVEQKLIKSSEAVDRIVRVRGQARVLARDLPLYKKVLQENGFRISSSSHQQQQQEKYNFSLGRFGRRNSLGPIEEVTKLSSPDKSINNNKNWRLLLCLTYSDSPCLQKDDMDNLKQYQKINRFPGLRNVLWKRDAFCSTMMMAKQLPAMRNEQVAPLCFVFPSQMRQILHVAQALGYTAKWTVKPISPASMNGQLDTGTKVFDLSTEDGAIQLQRMGSQKMIIQQLQESPLMVFGQPVSVRVYVLITSLAPLRAFVYSEGVVYHRYGPRRNFKKISGRTWFLNDLWQYIAQNYGAQSVRSAMANMYHILLQMLLIVEAAMLSSAASNSDYDICRHCFQLLGVDLIFNSSFHPVVLEVNGQPTLKETTSSSESSKLNRMKMALIDDVINLLFPKRSKFGDVSHEIAQGLLESTTDTEISDWSCPISSNMCLTPHVTQYLVMTRIETLNQGGFRQLYPSSDAGRYDGLVDQLQRHFTDAVAASFWVKNRRHTTADLHRLLINLERWYSKAASEEYYNDVDVQNEILTPWKFDNYSMFVEHQKKRNKNIDELDENNECSDDPSTMPFLSSIITEPQLNLSPIFSPLITEYYVNVSYDVTLVRLHATSQNCQTEARMDDRFGSTRATNTSLGVGENRISIMIVDIIHAEPWIINSYTLIIRRLPITHDEKPFLPSSLHQICSLKQECEMQTFSNEPCGLYSDQMHRDTSWTQHWKNYLSLPSCRSGDLRGRWLIPCSTCSDRKTCYWKEAAWHPFSCHYGLLSQEALRKCFHKKKLLFIGDSTNRGMMHYLIERLNGTLSKWDKTHDIRVYDNVNGGNTSVSFSYYPQFWLPTNQRPVFDKALYQLMLRSRPLENNSNTVLVVGGVHWLATQHLHMLLRAIRVERLQGIKLVMKTLGAGFHQPVDSVHTLSMEEQQKLILHNRGLADFARHYNFEVIDTFNVTIARYKDFMQGKCACHFHRVVEWKHSDVEEGVNTENKSERSGYHVEGPINAIYSEILLNRLCEDYVDKR